MSLGERLRLVPLTAHSEALEQVLAWNLQVWGSRIPGYDPEGWRAFYERCLSSNYAAYDGESELAWVIFDGTDVIGSIALVHEDDLPEYTHFSPWLAAFVIDPNRRHLGVGREVMVQFEEMVRGYGISHLYLWTDVYTEWYRSLGYDLIAHDRIGEIDMDVMGKAL